MIEYCDTPIFQAHYFYRQNINPHLAFDTNDLEAIFETARSKSKKVYALISLLHTCALRIQDAVGLTFGSITQLKPNKEGYYSLNIVGKKSSARNVMIDETTIAAIKAYQDEIRAKNDDIMFPPGYGRNPANKWTKIISKFFKAHGHTAVKSHDFRVT